MSEPGDAASASATAVIVGAGPAGLTAAYELARRTAIRPLVLEQSPRLGGLACTVEHRGNRIDIGGHRFFSKSDRVMRWWLDILPLERTAGEVEITYHRRSRQVTAAAGPDPARDDRVMLVRERRSRIYYDRQLFDYPLTLGPATLRKLGLWRTIKIGASYLRSAVLPNRRPRNLEEFFIARFGRELYETFFRDYTEKVWGARCSEISAEWGAQRVKGLSIGRAIRHFLRELLPRPTGDLAQKATETSLIERFLYPKLGPGQMWEEVAARVVSGGGEVRTGWKVERLLRDGVRLRGVVAVEVTSGRREEIAADWVFSSMPVSELVRGLGEVPADVAEVAAGLVYRDFVTVGILARRLTIREADGSPVRDNWIYVQEPGVRVGRLQIFNNWSPYLVADPENTVWLGLEYFCDEGDELWSLDDDALVDLARQEMRRLGILDPADVLDAVVLRVPKTYPAYFGTYDRFDVIRDFTDRFENLFLVGRNGMHKYNNQDHSMLTAMTAVDNILAGRRDRSNLWEINTEEDYHEEGEAEGEPGVAAPSAAGPPAR